MMRWPESKRVLKAQGYLYAVILGVWIGYGATAWLKGTAGIWVSLSTIFAVVTWAICFLASLKFNNTLTKEIEHLRTLGDDMQKELHRFEVWRMTGRDPNTEDPTRRVN